MPIFARCSSASCSMATARRSPPWRSSRSPSPGEPFLREAALQIEVLDDPDAVARAAATAIARAAEQKLAAGAAAFHLAVSGGSTPGRMFAALATFPLDWPRVHVWQVDERAA